MLVEDWKGAIEQELLRVAGIYACEAPALREAAEYVASSGGKRLRGLLTIALAHDLGGAGEQNLLLLAAALESLHAGSLVHDDLPALDNDDLRRGIPSCHRKFNEATAILTGDFLLGLSFRLIGETRYTDTQKAVLTAELSDTWLSLCVGQQLDLSGIAENNRRRMFELKTGALFGCAAAWGAIAAGRPSDMVTKIRAWGIRLGVLFQRLDDVADGDGVLESRGAILHEKDAIESELRAFLTGTEPITFEIVRRAYGRTC